MLGPPQVWEMTAHDVGLRGHSGGAALGRDEEEVAQLVLLTCEPRSMRYETGR